MNFKRYHRLIGITMLLPLLLWAVTGAFFIVKPGYGDAYEQLNLATKPVLEPLPALPAGEWLEIKQLHSPMGHHVLLRDTNGWRQVAIEGSSYRDFPSRSDFEGLLNAAIAHNVDRYGQVASIDGDTALTSTGVRLQLDWGAMQLSQQGSDTDWINTVYEIHYLRWTGNSLIDGALELLGLGLLVILTVLGLVMVVPKKEKSSGSM